MRGRTFRVPDLTADRRRLIAEAQQEAEQRRAAAAELALAGALDGATISPAARDLQLDLVADLLARHRAEVTDHDVGLRHDDLCRTQLAVTGTAEWSPADWAPAREAAV